MPRLTREQTIERLRALDREHGPLSFDSLDKRHRDTVIGAFQHFGGLPAARKAAGTRAPELPRKWSMDRIVNELRAEYRAGARITVIGLFAAGRHDLVSAIMHRGGIVRARRLARVPDPARLLIDPEPWGSWDDERVIAEILARHGAGESLASSKVSGKLISAGARLFGSWKNAIEVAGLDYDSIRLLRSTYTKQQICDELRKFRRARPDASRADLYSQHFSPAMRRLFGSLDSALQSAGLEGWPRRRIRVWNRKQIVAALRRSADRPREKGFQELALYYFGSVRAARIAAGLPPLQRAWSRKVVITELRALAKQGRYAPGRNLKAACERLFGGVVAARTAAGIPRPAPLWSRERVVKELRANARRGTLHVVDPLVSACCAHFDSVAAARKEAKIDEQVKRWPRRYVVAAMLRPIKDRGVLLALRTRAAQLGCWRR